MPQPDGEDRVVVVGAGIAGLSAARALTAAGRSVVVLERARGVGGRCATRRIEGGQPVDFGVAFLHGREPEFLAALAEVPSAAIPGWPSDVHGRGRPCQPEAFALAERRVAFVDGVAAFPRHLATGLDVRTGARVTAVEASGSTIRAAIEGAEPIIASTVILALAVEQALSLLASLGARSAGLETVTALLTMMQTQPCLTVIAAYPEEIPGPPWHVSYPEDSRILQLVSHDSSKRLCPARTVMVYQAHPLWSRDHLHLAKGPQASSSGPLRGDGRGAAAAPEAWITALLAEAARLLGPWAAAPSFVQGHRWTHARTERGSGLHAPILLRLPGDAPPGPRVGLAGELFFPGGGASAAWMSGVQLARLVLAEER